MDPFMICKLCEKQYREPRILPCFHTFCYFCLKLHFAGRNRRTVRVVCPTCKLDCELSNENLQNININKFISQLLDHTKAGKLMKKTEDCVIDDIPSFSQSISKEIGQEIVWVFDRIDEVNKCLAKQSKKSQQVRRSIEACARKCVNKNKDELLAELNTVVNGEKHDIEIIRTKLSTFFYGLKYHQRKISNCLNDLDLVSTLSDSRSFLDAFSDIKNLNECRVLKNIDFLEYPNTSYVLGKICYTRHHDVISHINPDGICRLISTLKFNKKLRTAAYCNQRLELFLIFPSCKEILVIHERDTLLEFQDVNEQLLDNAAAEHSEFSDCHQMKRMLVAKDLEDANDAVVCMGFLFISERSLDKIHRISTSSKIQTKNMTWFTGSYNNGLSVTPVDTILVACNSTQCLIEYTIDATKIRTIKLSLTNPRHALLLPMEFKERESGHYFAICLAGSKHDVVITNSNGKVVCNYPVSIGELKYPVNITLVKEDAQLAIVVCDRLNRRLLLCDRGLRYVKKLCLFYGEEIKSRNNSSIGDFQVLQTFYDVDHRAGEEYKIKCPAKTFLTDAGVLFVVDEDNNLLLKIESPYYS